MTQKQFLYHTNVSLSWWSSTNLSYHYYIINDCEISSSKLAKKSHVKKNDSFICKLWSSSNRYVTNDIILIISLNDTGPRSHFGPHDFAWVTGTPYVETYTFFLLFNIILVSSCRVKLFDYLFNLCTYNERV